VARDAYGVRYSRTIRWFEPQNHQMDGFTGLGLKTLTEVLRNRRHVAASRRSYLIEGAVAVG
jgi:hypothetical protein